MIYECEKTDGKEAGKISAIVFGLSYNASQMGFFA